MSPHREILINGILNRFLYILFIKKMEAQKI